jgi:hypothetical protein
MIKTFALIIGAMKCGTTSLFHYLAEHPQISPSRNKEPFFFCDDQRYGRGLQWYRDLWQWEAEHRVALEASTGYAMYPRYTGVVKRMAQVKEAEFRFIYIMRNPLDRIQSQIQHELAHGVLSTSTITEDQIAFSQYAMQLDAFAETFGKDHLHLLLLEDLIQTPAVELQKVCQFLKIDSDYQFQRVAEVQNSREDPSFKLYPWVKRLYRISAVNTVSELISPAVKEKLYGPLSNPQIPDVELSEQQRADVMARLKPDWERLETDYGIDVMQKWGLAA